MTGEIQRDLFNKESTEGDRFRDFLKSIFRSCSQIYSFGFLKETSEEFEYQVEAEELMEKESRGEIEGGDDF